LPQGKRVGIITWGGGWGVVASDACEDAGFEVPDLPMDLIEKLDEIMPDYWSRGNPIDLVGTLDLSLYPKCLKELAMCENIDTILALGILPDAKLLTDLMQRYEKPILCVTLMSLKGSASEHLLIYNTPEKAVKALTQLYQYHNRKTHNYHGWTF
jgi:acyl-CoA synthetase (NDP forming)